VNTIFSTAQILKLTEITEQKGVTPGRFQQILASGILADILEADADLSRREEVRKALKLGLLPPGTLRAGNPPEEFKLVVDFSMTLGQMVAVGKYDWKNDDIMAKQFSVAGEGQIEYEARLFNLERSISSADAEKGIREAIPAGQWEPGRIEHLLAFGAAYPEEQRKNPIVCLGSVSNGKVFGKRQLPYLYRRVIGRSLHLDWYGNIWHPLYRFLGVRKMSPKTAAI
jgi:hypothetical protein